MKMDAEFIVEISWVGTLKTLSSKVPKPLMLKICHFNSWKWGITAWDPHSISTETLNIVNWDYHDPQHELKASWRQRQDRTQDFNFTYLSTRTISDILPESCLRMAGSSLLLHDSGKSWWLTIPIRPSMATKMRISKWRCDEQSAWLLSTFASDIYTAPNTAPGLHHRESTLHRKQQSSRSQDTNLLDLLTRIRQFPLLVQKPAETHQGRKAAWGWQSYIYWLQHLLSSRGLQSVIIVGSSWDPLTVKTIICWACNLIDWWYLIICQSQMLRDFEEEIWNPIYTSFLKLLHWQRNLNKAAIWRRLLLRKMQREGIHGEKKDKYC